MFDRVAEYRWSYWDVDERQPGPGGGLELGELVDSDRVAALVEQGYDPDWRHFLIAFDEHGTYEVVCRGVRIEYETRRRMTDAERSAERAALAMAEPSYYPAMRSCPFDGRVLLIVMDTGDDRLLLHCMGCGRTYDSPHDLSRVHAAEPGGSARYRPANLDDIVEGGWEELLPFDEDGNPRQRPGEMDRGQD